MSEATNRALVAHQLAESFRHLARTDDGNDPSPADVLAFAEAATDADWRAAETLAGRTRPASHDTRTATLTILAAAAVEIADPFAAFTKDHTR